MTINKNRKKHTERSAKKSYLSGELAKKHKVSKAFVYKALSPTEKYESELAVTIQKDYNRIEKELPKVIAGGSKMFIEK